MLRKYFISTFQKVLLQGACVSQVSGAERDKIGRVVGFLVELFFGSREMTGKEVYGLLH